MKFSKDPARMMVHLGSLEGPDFVESFCSGTHELALGVVRRNGDVAGQLPGEVAEAVGETAAADDAVDVGGENRVGGAVVAAQCVGNHPVGRQPGVVYFKVGIVGARGRVQTEELRVQRGLAFGVERAVAGAAAGVGGAAGVVVTKSKQLPIRKAGVGSAGAGASV